MRYSLKSCAVLIATLLVAAGTAYGQQPPDVVVSDINGDTAMGSGALFSSAGTYYNTAAGFHALYSDTTGNYNTAVGMNTLYANNGTANTAVGFGGLFFNTIGSFNTATGSQALFTNTSGSGNTADGDSTLESNTSGSANTATGNYALQANTTGSNNTGAGTGALFTNSSGDSNTAIGANALYQNESGYDNTASGSDALGSNTTGYYNIASGSGALYSNTTGVRNMAVGHGALHSLTTGSYNIGLGDDAGYQLSGGSNNVEVANFGVSTDSGTIRIGTSGTQTKTFIAGIESAKVTGSAVYITSSGQLGVLASSERYKTAIAPMGLNTEKLQRLRPVTFHLKTEPRGAVQYGLIAEEVNKVYPELVIRDDAGKIQGVRYDELAPMLLSEVQQQQRKIDAQAAKIRDLEGRQGRIETALLKLQAKDELLAQR
jgi:hypothetical protein